MKLMDGSFPSACRRDPPRRAACCIPENHALDAWFKRAFGDEGDKKTPFALE